MNRNGLNEPKSNASNVLTIKCSPKISLFWPPGDFAQNSPTVCAKGTWVFIESGPGQAKVGIGIGSAVIHPTWNLNVAGKWTKRPSLSRHVQIYDVGKWDLLQVVLWKKRGAYKRHIANWNMDAKPSIENVDFLWLVGVDIEQQTYRGNSIIVCKKNGSNFFKIQVHGIDN